MRSFVFLSSLLFLTACGTTKLTRVGAPQPARALNCEFDVYTTAPQGSFVEIGTLDVNPGAYGTNVYRDLSDFKEEISREVCKSGGDAAIAYANGYGMWIKATVIKRTAPAPQLAKQAAPVAAAPQAAPVAAPQAAPGATTPAPSSGAAPAGCSYDTQCKGDRVCEAGQCVSPAAQ
jgi:hypothetical protein